MSEPSRVRFIGGPSDGLTMPWYDDPPPPSIRLPAKQNRWELPALNAHQEQTDPLMESPDALYYLARDERGYPSRADDGALRYQFHS